MTDDPVIQNQDNSKAAPAVRRNTVTAIRKLQKAHLDALTAGDGRGLSTEEMAEMWERETELPDLYEALKNIENDDGRIPATIWDMRNAALAKARGEHAPQIVQPKEGL